MSEPTTTRDPTTRAARRLEALLFAAGRTVSRDELCEAAELAPEAVDEGLDRLERDLRERGVQLLRLAGGFRLVTRPEHAEAVRRLLAPEPQKLTAARLETLAVVAYRQPATRAEVEAIRGVDCASTLKALLDLGLLEPRGRRKDKPGRPLLYGTTARFLEEFGLNDLADLPKLEDLDS